jgi:hypothetical protein
MRTFVFATTLLLSLSMSAQAQTQGAQFRGVSQFKIVVHKLDSGSVQCGLTEDDIRKAILYPASSANFQITDSAITGFFVSLTTLYFERFDMCVTHMSAEVRSYQTVTLQASGGQILSAISLWTRISMIYSAKDKHRQKSLQEIEDLTKLFVTDWNLDNK